MILHMDSLQEEVPALLDRLGLPSLNLSYPHALLGKEGHTSRHNQQYYSQLSRSQAAGQHRMWDTLVGRVVG